MIINSYQENILNFFGKFINILLTTINFIYEKLIFLLIILLTKCFEIIAFYFSQAYPSLESKAEDCGFNIKDAHLTVPVPPSLQIHRMLMVDKWTKHGVVRTLVIYNPMQYEVGFLNFLKLNGFAIVFSSL